MPRLPQPGGDKGQWGSILNDFLAVEHNADGSLKTSGSIGSRAPLANPTFSGTVTVPTPVNATDAVTKAYVDGLVSAGAPDADSVTKGMVQLTGDLGGAAESPTVPGLATKEDVITAGTTSQYFRGDKTWQTLDKATVGLANVENTADVDKPISAATQAALDAKLSTTTVIDEDTMVSNADDRIPTQQSVKAYVDTTIDGISEIAAGDHITIDEIGGLAIVNVDTSTLGANSTLFEDTVAGLNKTYNIPAGATMCQIVLIGGGGGGGSGRRGASGSTRGGGGGGQGGGVNRIIFKIPSGQTTIRYTIGAGGAGGAAVVVDDTDGNNGTNGGDSSAGGSGLFPLLTAPGGKGGGKGTTSGGYGGGLELVGGLTTVSFRTMSIRGMYGGGESSAESLFLSLVALGNATDNISVATFMLASPSGLTGAGGGGGGIKSDNTASTPSDGQVAQNQGSMYRYSNGAAGTVGSRNGAAPVLHAPLSNDLSQEGFGAGGGGGYPGIGANGGSGGDGSAYGGPGGGGGASDNGFSSGAGGNGQDGAIRITTW